MAVHKAGATDGDAARRAELSGAAARKLWHSGAMTRPRILLVPSFTELEWGIRPALEDWADVASLDMPGVGEEELPFDPQLHVSRASVQLRQWREAAVARSLAEVDRRGWDDFFVVTDASGCPTAVGVATARRESVLGLAMGHAALSRATTGERAPERPEVWDVLRQLARQGNEAFVRYGIAQATRGATDEETARRMIERFPDMETVAAMLEALASAPEPIGEELRALDRPLLLAKHEGCLGSTDEGFEDIVAAFPDAKTVICPEACTSSAAFADAIRTFCEEIAAVAPSA